MRATLTILQLHSEYQIPGGEETVREAEFQLLKSHDHAIFKLIFSNRNLYEMNPVYKLIFPIWNPSSYKTLNNMCADQPFDIVHIHNFFPLASPSVLYSAKAQGQAVVMTLHNYRLLCVNAMFFRQGHVCEACLGGFPWRGVVHGCYRNNRAASAVVASMLTVHRLLGTWTRKVDMYIALTEFARQKFIEGGLPADKIAVKPNFVHPDPGLGEGQGGFALFVGRLSREKGLDTLLAAWGRLQGRVPLKIVGDGPLASEVAAAAGRLDGVEWLGRKPREEVLGLMKQASFLVLPSKVYENFPMTIAEAFATGLPVVASGLGAMASLIDHERTGLHFRPGDAEDLAAKVEWMLSHPEALDQMRKEARAEYEAKYTAERNYRMLMEIYARAIENARKG